MMKNVLCLGLLGALFALGGCDDTMAMGDDVFVPPEPTECVWPEGTVGLESGQMMAAGTTWMGFAAGETEARTVSVDEFYDCDGTHGIDALLFTTSKFNCSRCSREARELEGQIAAWRAAGLRIEVITMLINDDRGGRTPGADACQTWVNEHGLENVWVLADGTVTFFEAGRFSTPMRAVVNPRNMQILEIVQGSTPYTMLESTAMANRPDWLPPPEMPDAGAMAE